MERNTEQLEAALRELGEEAFDGVYPRRRSGRSPWNTKRGWQPSPARTFIFLCAP